MGKETAIGWTDATFNPWWGCKRVSPACAHCYADAFARRAGHEVWDVEARRLFGPKHWAEPLAWNREAEQARRPRLVFCASMADVFEDHPALAVERERLWTLIEVTPWLVWQILTKRPENVERMIRWKVLPPNVWLGTSIENARQTWRARALVQVPATVHFLSCEPLLGSLFEGIKPIRNRAPLDLRDVEWVIGGGESGPRHRPVDLDHARELRDHVKAAGLPFFWKQHGGLYPASGGKTLDGREWCELPQVPPPAATTLF